jgi:predicted metal-dependent hydrolase
VQAGGAGVEVRLERGRLRVQVPRDVQGEPRARAVREALAGWYREHARERLTEQVAVWSLRMGQEAPRVQVREQERRWGSCSAGVVRFNWRIIQAPMRLVDYVVAHELVHLEHEAHGKEFWAALGRLLPDYEARREQLRSMGPRLIW